MAALKRDRLTFEAEPELRERLANWAREEGRPVSNLVRRIVTSALERRDRRQQAAERRAA